MPRTDNMVSSEKQAAAVQLGPESAEQVETLARNYLATHEPSLKIAKLPPATEYFSKNLSAMADGGPFWAVTYAVPVPRDENGKIVGVRSYYSFTVYLDPKGNVVNTMSHSP